MPEIKTKFEVDEQAGLHNNFFEKQQKNKSPKIKWFGILVLIIFVSCFFGFFSGAICCFHFYQEIEKYFQGLDVQTFEPQKVIEKQVIQKEYIPQTTQEEKIIKVVDQASPAVVSIIITKDVPVLEEYYISPFDDNWPFFEFQIPQYREKGVEKQKVGGGSGFIVSEDGIIITNKHVVLDEDADYTVFTNEGEKFNAKVLAKDPVQDIALLKIELKKDIDEKGEITETGFPFVKLGDSSFLQKGQTVIAIGNALGEFTNTVSVGVISGLGRTITASGSGFVETIEDVIQTDAAINKGNSGGPLLNLKGEVIGINTAIASGGAENIGFAICVNRAKKDIEQVKASGKIIYPFLGIHYVLINEKIQTEQGLAVDCGALIISGQEQEPAVFPDSPAEKAGLRENDIILEFENEKISSQNTLAKIIMKYNPGDKIKLKILRQGKEEIVYVVLDERKN